MLQLVVGEPEAAAATLTTLRAILPPTQSPDEWVLGTLERWPTPQALPLLRRLGASDPTGAWRYQIMGARLLTEAGRLQEARTALTILRESGVSNSLAAFSIGEVYLAMPDRSDWVIGCDLMADALADDVRNIRYRTHLVDCLVDLGELQPAYGIVMTGFEMVRDVSSGDALFDRLYRVDSKGLHRAEIIDDLRRIFAGAGAELLAWLEARLETF
jgi:hypothetical protein